MSIKETANATGISTATLYRAIVAREVKLTRED